MRYYFNLKKMSDSIPDQEGIEVENFDQVLADILKTINQMWEEEPDMATEGVGWMLEITNASSGMILLSVSLGKPIRLMMSLQPFSHCF